MPVNSRQKIHFWKWSQKITKESIMVIRSQQIQLVSQIVTLSYSLVQCLLGVTLLHIHWYHSRALFQALVPVISSYYIIIHIFYYGLPLKHLFIQCFPCLLSCDKAMPIAKAHLFSLAKCLLTEIWHILILWYQHLFAKSHTNSCYPKISICTASTLSNRWQWVGQYNSLRSVTHHHIYGPMHRVNTLNVHVHGLTDIS